MNHRIQLHDPYQMRWILANKGIPVGTNLSTGRPAYLKGGCFRTHLHLIGPPGSGKSRFLLSLFQSLCFVPNATIVLLNPKGALAHMAVDFGIAAGHTSRMVLFDPGQSDVVLGYNPLRANGLPVATHAKAVREAIRSAWGQETFDETPQLARILFYVLAAARELELTLKEAIELLRPRSEIRGAVISRISNPELRLALEYFDSLRESRQEELAASTLARLEPFILDPQISRILTEADRSIDIGEIIDQGKILIVNLEQCSPLRLDDVRLLGRFLVNDVVNHAFDRRRRRGPIFLILDEVQTFATHDLCNVLDQGRELGFHCILAHQNLGQLRQGDESGLLYESVMNCARTKVLFGGLSVSDLRILVEETMIEQFDPMSIKDELTTLELEPVESSRTVVARGKQQSFGITPSFGVTRSSGVTTTSGKDIADGRSKTEISAHSSGWSDTEGESYGSQSVHGESETRLPNGDSVKATTGSLGSNTGRSTSHSYQESETDTHGDSTSCTVTRNRSRSIGTSIAYQSSLALNLGVGSSETTSEVPFHEYRKRRIVSSRTFWTESEFLTMQLQRIKGMRTAHMMIKPPTGKAVFLRAPYVPDAVIGNIRRTAALKRIYEAPCYCLVDDAADGRRDQTALPVFPCARRALNPPESVEGKYTGPPITPRRKRGRK